MVPFLIIFFIISYFMISFDRHYGRFSSTCPGCQAKVSLNGCQDAVTLEFTPAITCFSPLEEPLSATVLTAFPFNNKASPAPILDSFL